MEDLYFFPFLFTLFESLKKKNKTETNNLTKVRLKLFPAIILCNLML